MPMLFTNTAELTINTYILCEAVLCFHDVTLCFVAALVQMFVILFVNVNVILVFADGDVIVFHDGWPTLYTFYEFSVSFYIINAIFDEIFYRII